MLRLRQLLPWVAMAFAVVEMPPGPVGTALDPPGENTQPAPDYARNNINNQFNSAPDKGIFVGPVVHSLDDKLLAELHQKQPDILSSSSGHTKRAENPSRSDPPSDGYWLSTLGPHGKSPWAPEGYQFFRNVRDFGAVGDGVADDTAAINRAASAMAVNNLKEDRCREDCGSTTMLTALVYFPPGKYLVSSPIVQYYHTQFVGNPVDRPILLGARNFTGIALVDSNPYIPGKEGKQWYIDQYNSLRQIRNFVFDLKGMPAENFEGKQRFVPTGIHWQPGKGTSISNCDFKMKPSSKSAPATAMGIMMESGSGGVVSDLSFSGGNIGFLAGAQQFTATNLRFTGVLTAVKSTWNWGFLWKNLYVEASVVAIDCTDYSEKTSQGTGSISLIDSHFNGVGKVITVAKEEARRPNIVIDNVLIEKVKSVVAVHKGDAILPGSEEPTTIKNWASGYRFLPEADKGIVTSGYLKPALVRPDGLLGKDSRFFTRSRRSYEGFKAEQIVVATEQGIANNQQGDQTEAINKMLSSHVGSVIYFPAGIYLVNGTVNIPVGSIITGSGWSQIMGTGPFFEDAANPKVMVRVGEKDDIGVIEISDMMFTVEGPTAGCVLIEWNIHEASQGSAAMWDSHFRVGGAKRTMLQQWRCGAPDMTLNNYCKAASMMMHVTPRASGYFDNTWLWVADHDLDNVLNHKTYHSDEGVPLSVKTQVTVFVGRGLLIESQGPTWFYGSSSEHSQMYQYQLRSARNVFMGHMQSETPYYQPNPNALGPYSFGTNFTADPTFQDCKDVWCRTAWALRVIDSSDIVIFSAGFYSFFQANKLGCTATESCQKSLVQTVKSGRIWMYNVLTKGTSEIISPTGSDPPVVVLGKATLKGYTSQVAAWLALAKGFEKGNGDGDGNNGGGGGGGGGNGGASGDGGDDDDGGNKDEGNKDEGNKDEGNNDGGNNDEGNNDGGNNDGGNDDGNKDGNDDGNKDDGQDGGSKNDGNNDDGPKDGPNDDKENLIYVDPALWGTGSNKLRCNPPCTYVLPPLTLPELTTITIPPSTTSLQVGWMEKSIFKGSDGSQTTTDVYVRVTVNTTLTIPAITTDKIPLSNVPIVPGINESMIYPIWSLVPPPFVITEDAVVNGTTHPVRTRTITPKPYPWANSANETTSGGLTTIFTSFPHTTGTIDQACLEGCGNKCLENCSNPCSDCDGKDCKEDDDEECVKNLDCSGPHCTKGGDCHGRHCKKGGDCTGPNCKSGGGCFGPFCHMGGGCFGGLCDLGGGCLGPICIGGGGCGPAFCPPGGCEGAHCGKQDHDEDFYGVDNPDVPPKKSCSTTTTSSCRTVCVVDLTKSCTSSCQDVIGCTATPTSWATTLTPAPVVIGPDEDWHDEEVDPKELASGLSEMLLSFSKEGWLDDLLPRTAIKKPKTTTKKLLTTRAKPKTTMNPSTKKPKTTTKKPKPSTTKKPKTTTKEPEPSTTKEPPVETKKPRLIDTPFEDLPKPYGPGGLLGNEHLQWCFDNDLNKGKMSHNQAKEAIRSLCDKIDGQTLKLGDPRWTEDFDNPAHGLSISWALDQTNCESMQEKLFTKEYCERGFVALLEGCGLWTTKWFMKESILIHDDMRGCITFYVGDLRDKNNRPDDLGPPPDPPMPTIIPDEAGDHEFYCIRDEDTEGTTRLTRSGVEDFVADFCADFLEDGFEGAGSIGFRDNLEFGGTELDFAISAKYAEDQGGCGLQALKLDRPEGVYGRVQCMDHFKLLIQNCDGEDGDSVYGGAVVVNTAWGCIDLRLGDFSYLREVNFMYPPRVIEHGREQGAIDSFLNWLRTQMDID